MREPTKNENSNVDQDAMDAREPHRIETMPTGPAMTELLDQIRDRIAVILCGTGLRRTVVRRRLHHGRSGTGQTRYVVGQCRVNQQRAKHLVTDVLLNKKAQSRYPETGAPGTARGASLGGIVLRRRRAARRPPRRGTDPRQSEVVVRTPLAHTDFTDRRWVPNLTNRGPAGEQRIRTKHT